MSHHTTADESSSINDAILPTFLLQVLAQSAFCILLVDRVTDHILYQNISLLQKLGHDEKLLSLSRLKNAYLHEDDAVTLSNLLEHSGNARLRLWAADTHPTAKRYQWFSIDVSLVGNPASAEINPNDTHTTHDAVVGSRYALCILRDVHHEANSVENSALYQNLFYQSLDPTCVIDVVDRTFGQERFTYRAFNALFEKTFSTSLSTLRLGIQDLVGKQPEEVFPKEAATALLNKYRICLRNRSPLLYDQDWLIGNAPYQRVHTFLVHLLPVDLGQGRLVLVAISRDVTALKDAARDQERLLRELAGHSNDLSRLSHRISHDLKTPLVTLRSLLRLISNDMERLCSPDMLGRLHDAETASMRMERLLHDLLQLSRADKNVPDIQQNDVAVKSVVDAVVAVAHHQYVHHAQITTDERFPSLYMDASRLYMLFEHLLENAIHFSSSVVEPRIHIGYVNQQILPRVLPRGMDPLSFAVLYVRDNGVGIPQEAQERVFSLFESVVPQKQTFSRSNGSGIGLTIVKRLTEAVGGRVWLQSSVGDTHTPSGTTIFLALPIKPVLDVGTATTRTQENQGIASALDDLNAMFMLPS